MSETTYQITEAQRALLDPNAQFHPVSFLDDGDLVIVEDAGTALDEDLKKVLVPWAVWVISRDGTVQSLAQHYTDHHDWTNEHPGRPTPEPTTPPPADVPRIIDTLRASQYLLLKYRVDVTPRTIRNWLRDGKLPGGQLGDAERAPWYTTRDAIDQAARRAWFPPPVPDIPTLEEAQALADLEADAAQAHYLADAGDVELDAEAAHDEWLAQLEDEPEDDDPRAPRDWAILTTADVFDDDDTEQEANDGLPANVP